MSDYRKSRYRLKHSRSYQLRSNFELLLVLKALAMLLLVYLFVGFGAGAVNSVDNLSFSSNNDFFDGEVFVLDFTGNDQTDVVDVFVGRDRLSSEVENGTVEQDISIDAVHTSTSAEYSFRDTGDVPIGHVDGISFFVDTYADQNRQDIILFLNSSPRVEDRCVDLNGDGRITEDSDFAFRSNVFRAWNFETHVYCYSRGYQLASVGEIDSSPSAVFSTNFVVSNGEKSVNRTITNSDVGNGTSTRIGDDVHIQWKGSVGTGKNAPIPTDELIAHSNSGGWRVVDRDNYRNYIEELRQSHPGLEDWKNGITSVQNIENRVNGAADQAYQNHNSTEFDGVKFNGTSIENGEMVLEIDNLKYPEFTIYVNACEEVNCSSFIQIEKNTGKPQITNVSTAPFSELDTGNVIVTFENAGELEGSFAARIQSCSQGFSYSDTSDTAALKPGESYTAGLEIGFSSRQNDERNLEGTCIVEVSEQSSDISVRENVSVNGIQQRECIAGTQFIRKLGSETQIRECSSNSLGSQIIETCGLNETAVYSNGYTCEKVQNSSTESSKGILDVIESFGNLSKLDLFDNIFTIDTQFSNQLDKIDEIISSIDRFIEAVIEYGKLFVILGVLSLYCIFILFKTL